MADGAALVDTYCATCHSERARSGGVAITGASLRDIAANVDIWERAIRQMRGGLMPPPGRPRPDSQKLNGFVASMEAALDVAGARRGASARRALQRLNRVEYANAIRDLLDVDVDVESLLPGDDSSYGFDNIADLQHVPPVLLERYLAAATTVSALAVGERSGAAAVRTYRVRSDLSQDQRIEGLPFGTRGGLRVRHLFPLDAEYVITPVLVRDNVQHIRGLEFEHDVEVSIDGGRAHLATIGGRADEQASYDNQTLAGASIEKRLEIRLSVKAGPRDVAVTFLQRSSGPDDSVYRPFTRNRDAFNASGLPELAAVRVAGPFNASGRGATQSRRRIFICRPDGRTGEGACAQRILSTLAQRAYRRTVTDRDLQPLLTFFTAGRQDGDFDSGIEAALQRLLISPQFIFRVEGLDPDGKGRNDVNIALASRLSFFLWNSIPDDRLLGLAKRGRLSDTLVRASQVRRLLADAKADAFIQNFAGQWLYLRNLENIVRDPEAFPDFDDNLRQSMRHETELLFSSIVREDRSVLDLLSADYTFVNERLARHYGIPGIYGDQFRRVTITDPARRGLLGQASILSITSHPHRTSPVLRGKWVLANILGTPPPPPPSEVPAFPENAGGALTSVRQRMEAHRASPACAGCHRMMDPIGFALEHFDAAGQWRTRDSGTPIDASGALPGGPQIDGAAELSAALAADPERFVRTLTEKLMIFALGRGVAPEEMWSVRQIVKAAAPSGYRFSSIVTGVVQSPPFAR